VSGKGTRAAVARRVDVVYRLLLLGLDRARIIEHVEKKYPTWGCGAAAIDRYIARAKQLLIEAGEQEREVEFGRALGRLHDLFARCLNDKDYRGALAVQKEINDLFGLKAPMEVNLNDARRQLVEFMVEEVMREAENATAGAGQAD
jgi:hypothetical protein